MTQLQHEYLEVIGGGSNKFYAAIHLGNGNSLVGYGPRSGRSRGNWTEMPESQARKKIREKVKNGYAVSQISSMPPSALAEASRRHQSLVGGAISIDPMGNLVSSVSPTPAPAGGPSMPGPRVSPRPRGPNPLKAWF